MIGRPMALRTVAISSGSPAQTGCSAKAILSGLSRSMAAMAVAASPQPPLASTPRLTSGPITDRTAATRSTSSARPARRAGRLAQADQPRVRVKLDQQERRGVVRAAAAGFDRQFRLDRHADGDRLDTDDFHHYTRPFRYCYSL